MHRKLFASLALLLGLWISSLPSMAELPKNTLLRDVQTHYWNTIKPLVIEPLYIDPNGEPRYHEKRYTSHYDESENLIDFDLPGSKWQYGIEYRWHDLIGTLETTLLLYENGDLYLTHESNPEPADFKLVLQNIKSISKVALPQFRVKRTLQMQDDLRREPWNILDSKLQYHWGYVTTALDYDGNLYLIGSPQKGLEENNSRSTRLSGNNFSSGSIYRFKAFLYTMEIDWNYPFEFQDDPDVPQKIATGIEMIFPGVEEKTFNVSKGIPGSFGVPPIEPPSGFYRLKNGDTIGGFPRLEFGDGGGHYLAFGRVLSEDEALAIRSNNDNHYIDLDYVLRFRGIPTIVEPRIEARNVKAMGLYFRLYTNGELISGKEELRSGVADIFANNTTGFEGYVWSTRRSLGFYPDSPAYILMENGDIERYSYKEKGWILEPFLSGADVVSDATPEFHGMAFKNASAWSRTELNDAYRYGLTRIFHGDDHKAPVTRQKFAALAVRLYEHAADAVVPRQATPSFNDTSDLYVGIAEQLGIVSGAGDGAFRPNGKVKRRDALLMFGRALGAAGSDVLLSARSVTQMFHPDFWTNIPERYQALDEELSVEQAIVLTHRLIRRAKLERVQREMVQ